MSEQKEQPSGLKFAVDAGVGNPVRAKDPNHDDRSLLLQLPSTAQPGNYVCFLNPYGNPVYAQVEALSLSARRSLSTGHISIAVLGQPQPLTLDQVIGIRTLLPNEAETLRNRVASTQRLASTFFDLTQPATTG